MKTKFNPQEIHPLAQSDYPAGKIIFIHSDNKEHSFSYAINELSGDVLSWFDNDPPSLGKIGIMDMFKSIRAKAKQIIKEIGKTR